LGWLCTQVYILRAVHSQNIGVSPLYIRALGLHAPKSDLRSQMALHSSAWLCITVVSGSNISYH
jgi:hypothetical protein